MKLTACVCGGEAAHDDTKGTVTCKRCSAFVVQPGKRTLPQFDEARKPLAPITEVNAVELWNRTMAKLAKLSPCCKAPENLGIMVDPAGVVIAKCQVCKVRSMVAGDMLAKVKAAIEQQKKAAAAASA